METQAPFPLTPSQLTYSYVRLPLTDIHKHLSASLTYAITITAVDDSHIWTINGIRRFFLNHYGGDIEDFPYYKLASGKILISLPPRLNRRIVIQECQVWASHSCLRLAEYTFQPTTFSIPTEYFVRLSILNFPLPFWDSSFFALAVAPFGELLQVMDENELGNNRSSLKIWIKTRDPLRIPSSLILDLDTGWVQCTVKVDTWTHVGWIPPPEDQDDDQSLDQLNEEAQPGGPAPPPSSMLSLLQSAHQRLLLHYTSNRSAPAAKEILSFSLCPHSSLTSKNLSCTEQKTSCAANTPDKLTGAPDPALKSSGILSTPKPYTSLHVSNRDNLECPPIIHQQGTRQTTLVCSSVLTEDSIPSIRLGAKRVQAPLLPSLLGFPFPSSPTLARHVPPLSSCTTFLFPDREPTPKKDYPPHTSNPEKFFPFLSPFSPQTMDLSDEAFDPKVRRYFECL